MIRLAARRTSRAKAIELSFDEKDFPEGEFSREEYPFIGNKYRLEYDRDSVIQLERQGFKVKDFIDTEDAPLKVIYPVFRGAFWKNHRDVSEDTIDSMMDFFDDETLGTIFENLATAIANTYETLGTGDADDPKKGKAKLRLV